MSFLTFLAQLQNIEKTRNFNVFKTYSLDDVEPFFLAKQNPKHSPIRISVVGTNGKGSTSHYLACILQKLGYRVGLYTSPHLLTPLERFLVLEPGKEIKINESKVESVFESHFTNLGDLKSLSYFEFLTLFAYVYFAENQVDYEIWEAGLGGRLDATKLVEADIVVLAKIGLDHCEILGDTVSAICQEKLGIIGTNTKSLFAMAQGEPQLDEQIQSALPQSKLFTIKGDTYLEKNCFFAKEICSQLLPNQKEKIQSWAWDSLPKPKGRMESLSEAVSFDPAHNPEAIATAAGEFCRREKNPTLCLGILPDKDADGIWQNLQRLPLSELWIWEGSGFASFPPEAQSVFPVRRTSEESELATWFSESPTPILVLGSFRMYAIVSKFL